MNNTNFEYYTLIKSYRSVISMTFVMYRERYNEGHRLITQIVNITLIKSYRFVQFRGVVYDYLVE